MPYHAVLPKPSPHRLRSIARTHVNVYVLPCDAPLVMSLNLLNVGLYDHWSGPMWWCLNHHAETTQKARGSLTISIRRADFTSCQEVLASTCPSSYPFGPNHRSAFTYQAWTLREPLVREVVPAPTYISLPDLLSFSTPIHIPRTQIVKPFDYLQTKPIHNHSIPTATTNPTWAPADPAPPATAVAPARTDVRARAVVYVFNPTCLVEDDLLTMDLYSTRCSGAKSAR